MNFFCLAVMSEGRTWSVRQSQNVRVVGPLRMQVQAHVLNSAMSLFSSLYLPFLQCENVAPLRTPKDPVLLFSRSVQI